MLSNEPLKLKGSLELVLRKGNGDVEVRRKDNIIVDVGFDFVADAIGKGTGRPDVMSHIALGTGTTTPAAGQTGLTTEISRLAATYAHVAGSKVFTFQSVFAAGVATGALTEAGVFNAAAAGIMFDRVLFDVINKGADDSMTATFSFTMS